MSGLNLRLSLVMLLLCRCVVEPTASTDPSGLAPRLVSNTYYGEDGSVLGKAETYDSKLKVPCAVLPAQDGKLRCLPQTEALILYLDAGCTQSLLAARPHSCTSAPQYALQPLFNTSCAYGPVLTRWAPYFVGAAVAAPVRRTRPTQVAAWRSLLRLSTSSRLLLCRLQTSSP